MWEVLVVSVFGMSSAQCLNLRFNKFLWQSAAPRGTRWLFRVMAKFGECNNTAASLHIVGSKVCISRFWAKSISSRLDEYKKGFAEAARAPHRAFRRTDLHSRVCCCCFLVTITGGERAAHQLHRAPAWDNLIRPPVLFIANPKGQWRRRRRQWAIKSFGTSLALTNGH